jgi:NTP pyrophosphatase (non-canonical NTP hydrolase)
MTYQELEAFVEFQHQFFLEQGREKSATEKERTFARTLKLGEEYGELVDRVMASCGNQRSTKIGDDIQSELEDEFSDVLISLLLLAKDRGVNILDGIDRKVERIKQKHNKQV